MAENSWTHFATVEVKGKPPYTDSGVDPKTTAHTQYPLVQALEKEAKIEIKRVEINLVPEGDDVRLEISVKRFDYDSEFRVASSRISAGIVSVLQGVFYYDEKYVREVDYREEKIGSSEVDSYEIKVYHRE